MKFNEHFGAITLVIQDFIDQYNTLRANKSFIPRSLQENNTFSTNFLGHQLQARKESQKEYKEPNELLLLRKEVMKFRDNLKLEDDYSRKFEEKLTFLINNITAFDNVFSKIQDRLWAYYLGKFGQGGWKVQALQIILNLDRWESENRFPGRENELLDGNVLRYEKRIHEFKLKLEKEMETIKPGVYFGVISYNEGELKKELEILKNEIPTQNFLQLRRQGVESFRRDWIRQSYLDSIKGILTQHKVSEEQTNKTIEILSVGNHFLDIKKEFTNHLEKKEDLDLGLKEALQKLLGELPSEEFEELSDPVLSRLAPALQIDPLLSSVLLPVTQKKENQGESEKSETPSSALLSDLKSGVTVEKLAKEIEDLKVNNDALREVNEVLVKKQVSLTPTYSASSAKVQESSLKKEAANIPSAPKRKEKKEQKNP